MQRLSETSESPLVGEAPAEPWWQHGLIFLGYLLLGITFTWPLVLHMGDGVIQKGGLPIDAGQGVWNLWWARSSLLNGQNPYLTRHIFYPLPINLFFQTLSLPNALLVLPILIGLGPVVAFNSVTLLSFGLGGYFSYRLALALLKDRPAALVAGFLFACGPYHIQRIWSGPMELIAIQWIPLYLFCFVQALARPSPLRLIGAAMALLITTLASQYYGLYTAVYTAGHGLLATLLAAPTYRWRTLGASAAVGILWLLGLVPIILRVGGVGDAVLEDWQVRQVFHSVALVDLISPNIQHPLWGQALAAWQNQSHPFGLENGAGLSVAMLLLVGIALVRRWKQSWPWAALVLGSYLLAMGPQLRFDAAQSPIPGPFLLLDLITPFRNSSRPSIFIALSAIALAVLCAQGFVLLNQRPRWGLGLLLVAELLVSPWPITPLRVAPAYQALNADPLPGAVLELPPRNDDSIYLLNQICHGRPLVGGYLARLPDLDFTIYPSATKRLWDADPPPSDILDLNAPTELAALGVRYVTIDLTRLAEFHVNRIRRQLAGPHTSLVYADASLEIYAISGDVDQPAATLGPGWYGIERDGERRWRWMRDRAMISLHARQQSMVKVEFLATAYGEARPLIIWNRQDQLTTLEIPAAPYEQWVTLDLMLPPGRSDLILESAMVPNTDGRMVSLAIQQMRITPIAFRPEVRRAAGTFIPATIPQGGIELCQ